MKESGYVVYVHTNKENGKRYVGITSKPKPEHRWSSGNGYKENQYFYSAIQKYGWSGFTHEIICRDLTLKEAIEMECLFIREWRTNDRDYGYNLTTGGEGTPGFHPSEETRKKLSECRRRENLSEETLKRRSDGLRGRKFSSEHKRKIGEGNSKAVDMYSVDGKLLRSFKSIKDAESELGISHAHISQCCRGDRKTSGGYRWEYAQSS